MTNAFAITLFLMICGAVLADQMMLDGANGQFLAVKFFDLVDYVKVWR